MVDVTPGVNRDKAADVHAFIEGPQTFGSFAEIFDRTVEYNPTRSAESLRRGILHNAHRRTDGTWRWNYDRGLAGSIDAPTADRPGVREPHPGHPRTRTSCAGGADLWEDVEAVTCP